MSVCVRFFGFLLFTISSITKNFFRVFNFEFHDFDFKVIWAQIQIIQYPP